MARLIFEGVSQSGFLYGEMRVGMQDNTRLRASSHQFDEKRSMLASS